MVVAIVTATVCLAAALVTSKLYWGYFWARPSLDRVLDRDDVAEVTAVAYVQAKAGDPRLTPSEVDVERSLSGCREHPYDCALSRGLLRLADRVPPDPGAPSPDSLAALLDVYESRPAPFETDGRDPYSSVWGLVIEYNDSDGSPRAFFAARGSAVSNDHYPFQELDLRRTDDGYVIVRRQHFFYDVAGIEGLEWPAFWILYGAVAFPLVAIGAWGRELWRFGRHRRRERPQNPRS